MPESACVVARIRVLVKNRKFTHFYKKKRVFCVKEYIWICNVTRTELRVLLYGHIYLFEKE